MKKRTRSILEELNALGREHSNDHQIEARASNIIESAINLLDRIGETYDADTSADLTKRFINSIRTQDEMKFRRGIRKANESKRHTGK